MRELTDKQRTVIEVLRADRASRAVYRALYRRTEADSLYAQLRTLALAKLPEAAPAS